MGYIIKACDYFLPSGEIIGDQNKQGRKIVDGRSSRKKTLTAVHGSRRLTV